MSSAGVGEKSRPRNSETESSTKDMSLTFEMNGKNEMTMLEVVKHCDKFPRSDLDSEYTSKTAILWRFFLPEDYRPHGFLVDSVVQKMPWTKDFHVNSAKKEIHLLRRPKHNWKAECSVAIEELLDLARRKNVFPSLDPKREEVFPIIGAKFPVVIDRSAISLFGIISTGVHLNLYTRTPKGIKIWIARRSLAKPAFAGKLDNAVAGGIAFGEDPRGCLSREAEEEAALNADWVYEAATDAGFITWFYISDKEAGGENGLLVPGISYIFDLEIQPTLGLRPVDGDIHEFLLGSVGEVKKWMAMGMFKPMCANVMMDFLIRHGHITEKNEKDFAEIVKRLHGDLPFPKSAD